MKALAGLVSAVLILFPLAAARAAARPVTDQVLPSGVRILVERDPDTALVAIDVFVKTAGAPEDARYPGLADFTARTLLSGTTNEDAETIADEVGDLGGNVDATWDRNFTQIRSLTLASRYADAAYLVSDVLKNASFEPAAVEQARKDLLRDDQNRADDIFAQAYDRMKAKLYAGMPIQTSEMGDPAVIRALRPADLRAFYDHYYTPDNIVIAVVGDVDPDQAVKAFQEDLADFDRASVRSRQTVLPADVTPLAQPETVKSYRGDISSGYVLAGFLVPGAGSPDYPDLLLLNALLGGMKTSLMFTNLREKQGLAYETGSLYGEDVGVTDLTGYILSPGDGGGNGGAHGAGSGIQTIADAPAQAAPASAGPSFSGVRDALLDQFKQMRAEPPTDAMLTRAKKFVIGSYLIGHERLQDRAYWLGFSEIALKPLGGYLFDQNFAQAIDAVTPADIQHVAQKYLSAGYVVSMVLPGDPNAGDVTR